MVLVAQATLYVICDFSIAILYPNVLFTYISVYDILIWTLLSEINTSINIAL